LFEALGVEIELAEQLLVYLAAFARRTGAPFRGKTRAPRLELLGGFAIDIVGDATTIVRISSKKAAALLAIWPCAPTVPTAVVRHGVG
jgi:hypothetical protein